MTYRGPKRVRVEDKPLPSIEHPGDAVVRVTRAAICGSDIHLFNGLVPDTRVGFTFGHEFTGVVEEVGSGVENVKPGDRVLVPFTIACGSCFWCRRQLYSNCHHTNPNSSLCCGIYGYSHTTGGYDGGQAEYVRVPFADVNPMVIPDDIDEDDALLLTDACPTGYQAAEMAEIGEGDSVLIFGAGPVGIFAAQAAWLMGAGRVVVTDHVEYRLDFVRTHAQCEVVNYREHKDPVVHFKRITDYVGFDRVIDAVGCDAAGSVMQTVTGKWLKLQGGSATALHWAINSVRKNGIVSVIGVYGPPWNLAPIGSVMNKGLTIRSAQCNVKRYLPRLLEHVRAGRLNPKEVLTHRIPLEEIAEGYHRFTNKLDHMIKPVVVPARAAA
jgi:threonine dehydrogenase-like Zn-dependent dehydrogenase